MFLKKQARVLLVKTVPLSLEQVNDRERLHLH